MHLGVGIVKNWEPEYEKAAKGLNDMESPIKLVKVDATVETKLGESYNVKGYPTLIFFIKGKMIPYEGDRNARGIIDWVTRKSGPPSRLLTSIEEQDTFAYPGGVVVGVFANEHSPNFAAYKKVAQTVDNFIFAHRFDATESIIVVTKDRDTKTFTDEITEENLKNFIEKEGFPLVVELDQKTWVRSLQAKLTLLTCFYNPADQSIDNIKSLLKEIALENKGKVIVAYMDGVQNEQLITRWGGTGKVLPTVFVVSFTSEQPKVISWNEETETSLTKESVQNFLIAALDGTYQSYKKSEEIPETNDQPVKKVVAKNFDSIVNDPTKDVLLEIYAPWCGHCKNLEPIYIEVAKKFADTPSVTIAKFDGTANALPENIQVKGYPTILFFPSQ